jgi:hypothetical protein
MQHIVEITTMQGLSHNCKTMRWTRLYYFTRVTEHEMNMHAKFEDFSMYMDF